MNTLEIREAVKKRKQHEAKFAQEQVLARGNIIARNGSTSVQGLRDHIWVAPQGEAEPVAVYNRHVKGNRDGLGVYIGFAPGSSILEVLRTDVESTAGFVQTAGLDMTLHARSHLVGEGDDPLFIYARAIVMLLTYAGEDLAVSVSPYSYLKDGQLVRFQGALNYDLSSHTPAAGLARWVLVGLNVQTGTLAAVAGDTAVDTLSVTPPFPEIPADVVASAYVRLAGGQTQFNETRDFIDARDFLDKPRRISSLSAADGSPDPAWSVDNDGNLSNPGSGVLDLNGIADALVLDADADTSISSPADDQIDFEAGGADVARVTAAGLTVLGTADVFPQASTYGLNARFERLFGDDKPANSYQFTRRSFAVNNFAGNIAGFEDATVVASPFSTVAPASDYTLSYTANPHFLTMRNFHASTWMYLEWSSATAKNNCNLIWAALGNETIIGASDSLVTEFRFWDAQSPGAGDKYYAVRMRGLGATTPQHPGQIEYWYGTGTTLTTAGTDGTLGNRRPYYFGAVYQSTFNILASSFAFSDTLNLVEGFGTGGAAVQVATWPSQFKCVRFYVPPSSFAFLFIDQVVIT